MSRALSHVEQIEAGMVAALKECLHAEYLIDHFPDRPEEFDRQGARAIALVQYAGSSYARPEAGNQARVAEYVIHLELNTLDQHHSSRASSGGTKDVDQIRLALQGRVIEGAEVYMVRDGLVGQSDGLWLYEITVRTEMPAVPHRRPAPIPSFIRAQGAL